MRGRLIWVGGKETYNTLNNEKTTTTMYYLHVSTHTTHASICHGICAIEITNINYHMTGCLFSNHNENIIFLWRTLRSNNGGLLITKIIPNSLRLRGMPSSGGICARKKKGKIF